MEMTTDLVFSHVIKISTLKRDQLNALIMFPFNINTLTSGLVIIGERIVGEKTVSLKTHFQN